MTKRLGVLATLALLTALLGAWTVAAADDSQDVRNILISFVTAWNDHDMVAFGKLFAPDAEFVNVVGARWKGRESIQMHHAWFHGTIPESTKVSGMTPAQYGMFKHSVTKFVDIDVRFIRKEVAVVNV